MLLISDPLNDEVEFGEYHVHLDMAFNRVLIAVEALGDKSLAETDRVFAALDILIDGLPKPCKVEAVDTWLHALPLDDLKKLLQLVIDDHISVSTANDVAFDLEGNPLPVKPDDGPKVMSFKTDGDLIFASFMQAYKIDLIAAQDTLHWAKFVALLNGLPDGTALTQVEQIRRTKPYKGMSAEDRKNLYKMQKRWAIPEDDESEAVDDGS